MELHKSIEESKTSFNFLYDSMTNNKNKYQNTLIQTAKEYVEK